MTTEPELQDLANPSGIDGIEFIEYATARPRALGHVLELMGFQPAARHRSREVLLYRQGAMNVVINAHDSAPQPGASPGAGTAVDAVRISAIAFRARDAAAAYRRALDRGAWAVPRHVEVMELHSPAIGVDATKIFLVQLADFMWSEVRSSEERIETARHFRVFPGEGVHTAEVAEMVRRLVANGYRGDFSFEVFNDDYVQLRPSFVAARARRAAEWLGEEVLQRPVPLRTKIPRRPGHAPGEGAP